jgi:acyl carrier protein
VVALLNGARTMQKPPPKRRDDAGRSRTKEQVERAVIAIVAKLSGEQPKNIRRTHKFEEDLGWDAVYKRKVIKPIREKLHVEVDPDELSKRTSTVGKLIDHVWSLMTPVTPRARVRRLLVLALALPVHAAAAQESPLQIGHAYSSARSLGQPATFIVVREGSGPWLTKFDFGLLYPLPLGRLGALELGARASAGSARPARDRVLGAMIRKDWPLIAMDLLLATSAAYEADGGLDMQKGLIGAELTPLGSRRLSLGIFSRRIRRIELGRDGKPDTLMVPVGFRWRPWLGAGVGHVFTIDAAPTREDSTAFFRAYGRVETAMRVPVGRWFLEGDFEGTAWYVGGFHGDNFAKGSLSLAFGRSGVSLTATGEAGRQPPRFTRVQSISLGIGFRYPG